LNGNLSQNAPKLTFHSGINYPRILSEFNISATIQSALTSLVSSSSHSN